MVHAGWWAALVVGSLVAGAAFVGILVAPRRVEPVCALVGALGFGLSALAFASITRIVPTASTALATLAIIAGSLVGGYAVASALLDRVALPMTEEASLNSGLQPRARDDALVIVLACAESEEYDPRIAASELRTLASEELVELSIGVTPFLFTAQKARYRSVGGISPQRRELRDLAEMIEPELDPSIIGGTTWAVCSGSDSLAHRIVQGAAEGYRAFAVIRCAVADAPHFEHARRGVDSLRPGDHGIEVVYADALWSSDAVAAAVTEMIVSSAGAPGEAGVALVGHGQPESRSRLFPAFDEQETAFANRVRMMLTERGIPERNIHVCWSEWRAPDVTSTVRHLAALDCKRILVAPVAFPANTLARLLDIPLAVRQARVESVPVVTVSAWFDNGAVKQELIDRAHRAAREALANANH